MMEPPMAPPATAPPTPQLMIRMMNGLARKGAYLDAKDGGFILMLPGAPRRRVGEDERSFSQAVVEAANRQGWIVRDGAHYRLTEAGALALHSGLAPQPPSALAVVSPRVAPVIRPPAPKPPRRPSTTPSHQMEAAERLAGDFQTGQMTPRVTSNWDRVALGAISGTSGNPSGRGVDVSERISAAQERVRRALSDAGPEFADVLIDLCCLETGIETFESKRGWPRRSAKLVLGLALDRLARHYGIVGRSAARGHTQHWGASGYRPA